jgi:hypothetical protein
MSLVAFRVRSNRDGPPLPAAAGAGLGRQFDLSIIRLARSDDRPASARA